MSNIKVGEHLQRKRKFSGKTFTLVGEYNTKPQALVRKKRVIETAIPVRVVRTKHGYSVWARV